MNEMITINYDNPQRPVVSGRELHAALQIETPYKKWFERMTEYGFTENKDFWTNLSESTGGRPATDHMLTIPMAKELCMIQRTEIGRRFRQYFISIEEAWNSPEMVMQRALTIANDRVKALQLSVSQLTVENQIMQPKAEYFDELVDRNLLTGIRDTAKELHIRQKDFVNFLLDKKYLYRNKKGKLLPYAQHMNGGLFELKEFVNQTTGYLEHATFSNIEQMSLEFVMYTLSPWLVRWEQSLMKALLSDSEKGKYFIKFNVEGLLRGDYASRMQGYSVGIQNGFLCPNDVRELEDMNLIPEEKGGFTYMVNGSMTPLSSAGAAYAKNIEKKEDNAE